MGNSESFKRVLITRIQGPGGKYLAESIVNGHPEIEVHGISRWHSTTSSRNLASIEDLVILHECELNDFSSILNVLEEFRPDAIFHLASHANVRDVFITLLSVINNNVMGINNLFEAIRAAKIDPIVQLCSTSEVYGQVDPKHVPILEDCPINPSSPYAVSKATQDLLGLSYYCSYQMKNNRTRMFAYFNPRR